MLVISFTKLLIFSIWVVAVGSCTLLICQTRFNCGVRIFIKRGLNYEEVGTH